MTVTCSPTETFICRLMRTHHTLYALTRLGPRNKVPQQHNTIETTRLNGVHLLSTSATKCSDSEARRVDKQDGGPETTQNRQCQSTRTQRHRRAAQPARQDESHPRITCLHRSVSGREIEPQHADHIEHATISLTAVGRFRYIKHELNHLPALTIAPFVLHSTA